MEPAKKFIIILGGVGVVLSLVLLAPYGWQSYKSWRFQRTLNEFSEEWKRAAELDHQAAMADTYGGKTPQETLKMFIAAVEKGDYGLASKYFIREKQEGWKKELIEIAEVNKIESFLSPVRDGLKNSGEYSFDGESYAIQKPVLLDFVLYPNGTWKLVRI
ncbi:MAG TPA: hypothetical protein VJA27_04345 [Patescibacteria group bacterium]|nr:hypothetical protein [Patescibacteria group bacterium]